METSGHWPGLRKTAQTIREQLLTTRNQLLDLWMWGNHNTYLTLELDGDQPKIMFMVEEELLFSELHQHLPDQPAWMILADWKKQVRDICLQLIGVCDWVNSQAEIEDKNLIPNGESAQTTPGIRERYAQTVVRITVGFVHNRPMADLKRGSLEQCYCYHIERSTEGERLWTLKFKDDMTLYLLASSRERQELEQLKSMHIDLCAKLRDQPQLQEVVEGFRSLSRLDLNLEKELSRLENLAKFPGTCELCSG